MTLTRTDKLVLGFCFANFLVGILALSPTNIAIAAMLLLIFITKE